MVRPMRALLSKNSYLKSLYKISRGARPVYLDYDVDFSPRWTTGQGNRHIEPIIAGGRETYISNLHALTQLEPLVRHISDHGGQAGVPDWKNHFMPALDALTLMQAASKTTSTYLEVGSGNSTLFVRQALNFFNHPAKIVSIDPEPRSDINALCDEVIRRPLEDVDLSLFDRLQPGDTLFIDNSHRAFMNSDVTVCMLDILPRLKSGVRVGIHDIFLPYDYPESWSDRAYNEQYLLACYLLANPRYFDLQFANYWICAQGLHVEPLQAVWDVLGDDVRDRRSSAFWGIKA